MVHIAAIYTHLGWQIIEHPSDHVIDRASCEEPRILVFGRHGIASVDINIFRPVKMLDSSCWITCGLKLRVIRMRGRPHSVFQCRAKSLRQA
jgi:hypothetical protein